ncbi:hypothetical protein VTK56DRAFT_5433 [Thermocarpiscus australiensis]
MAIALLLVKDAAPTNALVTLRKFQIPAIGLPLHQLPAPSGTGLIDIRSFHAAECDNLDIKILEGLSQPLGNKYLPPLLLWDEKGQTLYDDILATEYYYPYRVEHELLREKLDEITSTIASSGADLVVELGAGNMTKTAHFLSSLDKYLSSPLIYYALDVDRALLERSLTLLRKQTKLQWVKVCGLLGTYEDGARWLARPEISAYRKTLVWLGNSIANYEQHQASELLASFTEKSETGSIQNLAGILISVDGCQETARIERAYDVPGGQSRRWVTYALEAARRHLGSEVGAADSEIDRLLAADSWKFEGRWHPERQRYENFLVPTRRLVGAIRGQPILLEEGERVSILVSGKWTVSTVSNVCLKPGLEVQKSWHNAEINYGVYWLQPSLKRHDSGIGMMVSEGTGEESQEAGVEPSS